MSVIVIVSTSTVPVPITSDSCPELSGPYIDNYGPLETNVIIDTHGHTDNSDGSLTPAQYAAAYEAKNHDALIMTDHDVVTADPGGHGLIYIPSNELSASTGHIVSINSDYTRGGTTDRQTQIDAIVADGGYAILAHPKWNVGFSQAVMAALTDYLGIEIFNMQVEVGSTYNPITYPGFDIIDWDYLLTNVRYDVWGIASDDFHTETDWRYYDSGRLILFTNAVTYEEIKFALEHGNFAADVCNYGVTIAKPDIIYPKVTINCPNATKIRFIGDGGALLSEIEDSEGEYTFEDTDTYVRIEVVGDYTEDFADALDDRWSVYDGTWTVAGGILTLSATANNRRYILRRFREGDFEAQVDVRFNDTSDDHASLMFNVLDLDKYYILRLGTTDGSIPDWENRLCVGLTEDGIFSDHAPIDSYSFSPSGGTWYTIKMKYTYSDGGILAKVWETGESEPDWQIDTNDTTWKHGSFGFRAAHGPIDFDNLYINGFKTYYQPIPVGDWV